MILEVRDILDNKVAIGHSQAPPPGVTLGYIFSQHDELKAIKRYVFQVKINSTKVDDWEHSELQQTDRVEIDIAPQSFGFVSGAIAAVVANLGTALAIAGAVLSVVQFVVSLFNRPKATKLDAPKESSVYSWDGIKTSFSPGSPVPVLYGEPAAGGQLISLAIDVDPVQPNKQLLSMLLGEGCGTITNVNCIKINGIAFSNFNNPLPSGSVCDAAAARYWQDRPDVAADPYYGGSPQGAYDHYITFGQYEGSIWHAELCNVDPLNVSWDWRAGYSSQAPMHGFELARNTFSDGREVSSLAITYTTQGNQVDRIQLQVAALQGLGYFWGGTHPRLGAQTVRYRVEYRSAGVGNYVLLEDRPFTAADRGEVWDAPVYNLTSRSSYDVRLTWLSRDEARDDIVKGDQSLHHIWLRNVTEMSGQNVETYSGTALLAVKAVATNQLQGGAPTITAVFRGRDVRCYTDLNTYVTTWTRNPAWCVLDYMTNSVYGMGPWVPTSAINIQSFIDFATLCNSQVSDGAGGLEAQHCLDLVMDKKKPHWQWIQDILGLYRSSMIYSQGKFKVISDRGDLPLRQVFHSGNIVPGTFQMTIGAADPSKPNQINLSFPNRLQDFNMDTVFVVDSASVYGRNEPIKDVDVSLIGVTRESEVLREGYFQLQRRRQSMREMTFSTGLEALAVEPGDMCRVGIVTTNFEMGFGGRVMEGDVFNVVLDREVTVSSGYTYDFYLWHSLTDTPEVRTLATTPGPGNAAIITITVSATNPFNIAPANGDRWAIGITSEDLKLCFVKKIGFDPQSALHQLTVEEYIPTIPITPTLVSTTTFYDLNAPPAQPISVKGEVSYTIQEDGTLVGLSTIDVVPAPLQEGGLIGLVQNDFIRVGSITVTPYAFLGGSHSNVLHALNGDAFRMNAGSAGPVAGANDDSAGQHIITNWTGSSHIAYYTPLFGANAIPHSGDPYTLLHRGGIFDGFDVYRRALDIENVALYSEALDNAVWTKTNAAIVTDAGTAPSGFLAADKLIETSAAAGVSHFISQSLSIISSEDVTFSHYAKAAERAWIFLQISATSWGVFSGLQGWFNVASGTQGTVVSLGSMTAAATAIESAANGFYRVSLSGNVGPHSDILILSTLADHDGGNVYVGTSGSGAYFWGAQFEEDAILSDYLATSSTPVGVSFSTDYMFVAPQLGTHWEESSEISSRQTLQYKIVPFNTRGVRNYVGDHEFKLQYTGVRPHSGFVQYANISSINCTIGPGLVFKDVASVGLTSQGGNLDVLGTTTIGNAGAPGGNIQVNYLTEWSNVACPNNWFPIAWDSTGKTTALSSGQTMHATLSGTLPGCTGITMAFRMKVSDRLAVGGIYAEERFLRVLETW